MGVVEFLHAGRSIRLDTIAGAMDPAIALYRSMSLREISLQYTDYVAD